MSMNSYQILFLSFKDESESKRAYSRMRANVIKRNKQREIMPKISDKEKTNRMGTRETMTNLDRRAKPLTDTGRLTK